MAQLLLSWLCKENNREFFPHLYYKIAKIFIEFESSIFVMGIDDNEHDKYTSKAY